MPPSTDAFAVVRDLLESYGLGSLSDWAWERLVEGDSETQIRQSLRERDEFKTRFAGLEKRRQKGLPPLSVDEYLSYERQAFALMRSYGMPAGFYDDTADFADFIGNDVSIVELEQRLTTASEAVYQAPVETRAALRDLYGIPEESLAAFFLDEERGLQALQQQFRAAQTAGAAQRTGFGALEVSEAERVGSVLEPGQAEQAFGELAQSREVIGALAGEDDAFSREEQLAAVTGDVDAQRALEQRRRRRRGFAEAGGGFASDQGGFGGLGSSDS